MVPRPSSHLNIPLCAIYLDEQIRNRECIIFINIYRSPSITAVQISEINKILNVVKRITKDKNPNIILGGDINAYHEKWGSKNRSKYKNKFEEGDMMMHQMAKHGLININDGGPTRAYGTAVDVIFITKGLTDRIEICRFDRNNDISDHYPCLIRIKNVSVRRTINMNYDELNIADMNNKKWIEYDDEVNAELKILDDQKSKARGTKSAIIHATFSSFKSILKRCARRVIGLRTKQRFSKPWMTPETKRAIDAVHAMKKRYRAVIRTIAKFKKKIFARFKRKATEDEMRSEVGKKNYQHYDEFDALETSKARLCRRMRRNYQHKRIKSTYTTQKDRKYWKIINDLDAIEEGTNAHTLQKIIKPSKCINKKDRERHDYIPLDWYCHDDDEMTHEVNEYFNTISCEKNPNYRASIQGLDRAAIRNFDREFDYIAQNMEEMKKHENAKRTMSRNITESEIRFHFNKMMNNKMVIGGIMIIMVKKIMDTIVPWLVLFYNYWKDSADISDNENTRIIKPLTKPRKKWYDLIKSLRPVSLQSVIWKGFERTINGRIYTYAITMDILSIFQCGSKKANGSEDCITHFVTDIRQQTTVALVPSHAAAIDESDAYDSQAEIIIYDKCEFHMGMDNDGITMCTSLLKGRTSRTEINGKLSSLIRTESGPYQGASASQTFWAIYINPVIKWIEKQHLTMDGIRISVKPRVLIDDITIHTMLEWIDSKIRYRFDKNTSQSKMIHVTIAVQNATNRLFQAVLDMICYYLRINNIPMNRGKTQIITFDELEHKESEDEDPFETMRKHQFVVYNKQCNKDEQIIVLGITMHRSASQFLDTHAITTVNRMKRIRVRCYRLMQSNRVTLSAGSFKGITQALSLSLLNYCGAIVYAIIDEEMIKLIEGEVNEALRMINRGLITISYEARRLFNGFVDFKDLRDELCMKAWASFIRKPESNPLITIKQKYINKWQEFDRIIYWEFETKTTKVKEENWNYSSFTELLSKKGMIITAIDKWYLISKEYNLSDTFYYYYTDKIVKRAMVDHIPRDTPQWLIFNDTNTSWRDDQINTDRYTIFIDGSVYSKYNHEDIENYGAGGAAIRIYYREKIIYTEIIPISIRTHINICELCVFEAAFSWVNNHAVSCLGKGVDIVSDSQNCINTLNGTYVPQDEVIMRQHKQIDDILQSIDQKKIALNHPFEANITINWVESHHDSDYNNEIDGLAKIAACLTMYAYNDLNPNKYIAYNTIKGEIKSLIQNKKSKQWNEYVDKNMYSITASNYRKQNIKWSREWSADLDFYSIFHNNLRMLLITTHLPLNFIRRHKFRKGYTAKCEQCDAGVNETMEHFLFYCDRYEELRQNTFILMNQLIDEINSTEQKNKLENINNMNEYDKMKLLIYTPRHIQQSFRVEIKKTIFDYVILTKRFDDMKDFNPFKEEEDDEKQP
eukprot:804573_1